MAIKPSHILGMNARHRYTKMNPRSARKYGFSKLKTKDLLVSSKIPTAEIYHIFSTLTDLENINWETIPAPFVIKPANGSAGKGIWVIEKKLKNKSIWVSSHGEKFDNEDLSIHVSNILDGEFSVWGTDHKAIVEELIPPHPDLAKYSYRGTPDVRVIVFNSVPVMAMARIPTNKSNGRANLDQGAVGLGIDMASGLTTGGISGKSGYITKFPGTKKKLTGIQIPQWDKVLFTAVRAAQAAGYVFMGADLFIHPEKGPMIVELNTFPGLSIQLCNQAGLKRRLERVEGLDVRNAEHGVKIAKALFAESFGDQTKAEEGLRIIPINPAIGVYSDRNKLIQTLALANTGRFRSAISEDFAEELGLVDLDDLLWQQKEGVEGKVPVVEIKFKLKGNIVKTAMVVLRRLNRTKHSIELGRRDLRGFLVGDLEE